MDHGDNDRVNGSGDNLVKGVGERGDQVMGRASSKYK